MWFCRHSRSRLDPEGAHFVVAPAHGLEGGIVVAQLTLTGHEVLTLEDGHATLPVVLGGKRSREWMTRMSRAGLLSPDQTG